MGYVVSAPDADIYTIDVSFQALKDRSERAFLNQLPTSFALSGEAVDRLRAAAAKLVLESSDLRVALKDAGLRVIERSDRVPLMPPTPPVSPGAPAAK